MLQTMSNSNPNSSLIFLMSHHFVVGPQKGLTCEYPPLPDSLQPSYYMHARVCAERTATEIFRDSLCCRISRGRRDCRPAAAAAGPTVRPVPHPLCRLDWSSLQGRHGQAGQGRKQQQRQEGAGGRSSQLWNLSQRERRNKVRRTG